jgi:hypothetical protein
MLRQPLWSCMPKVDDSQMPKQVPACPNCRGPMEAGVLGAASPALTGLGGARWYKSKSFWAVGGEPVGGWSISGMAWIDGHRCTRCHIMLLRY